MNARKVEKILVSQPKPNGDKSPYFDIAEKFNVVIDFHPFIRVERLSVKEFRQQRINILDFTGIVLTAKTAVDHFFSLCEELRITVPDSMRYFCISESVALYLQKYIVYRKRKIFFSQTGKIEGLNNAFTKHFKETFLFPVPEEHRDEASGFLDRKKLNYVKSVMYRTVSNEFMKDKHVCHYDMAVFFSPLGIQSLFKNFPDFEQGDMAIGCFGNSVARAIEDAGLTLHLEAPQPDLPSMTAALEAFLKENHKAHK